jgi:hydroxymethylpyrimidine/phosphomethylpyrimidine kinase
LDIFTRTSCISLDFVIRASSISPSSLATPSPAGKPPIALTIAGFDPSSGAGVTADLKVFATHGIYGLAAITALTVQSTQGVRHVEPVSPEVLGQTLECLAEDMEISGVKIGMLATEGVVGSVRNFLAKSHIPKKKVVLDPVLRSSSGRELLSREGLIRLKSDLLPRVGWVTPNIDEVAVLAGIPVHGREAIPEAVARLATKYPALNVAVTGGHFDPPDDFLRTSDGSTRWFAGERVATAATHGTGCAFSSALLAHLIAGDPPDEAVAAAKAYVTAAMKVAKAIGKGRGPLHHFYRLD